MTARQKNGRLRTNLAAVVIAAISAIPPSLVAGLAYLESSKARLQTEETHKMVNSRLTEVIPLLTKGAADAATLEEKKAQSAREGTAAVAVEAAKPTKSK